MYIHPLELRTYPRTPTQPFEHLRVLIEMNVIECQSVMGNILYPIHGINLQSIVLLFLYWFFTRWPGFLVNSQFRYHIVSRTITNMKPSIEVRFYSKCCSCLNSSISPVQALYSRANFQSYIVYSWPLADKQVCLIQPREEFFMDLQIQNICPRYIS